MFRHNIPEVKENAKKNMINKIKKCFRSPTHKRFKGFAQRRSQADWTQYQTKRKNIFAVSQLF